jgi:SNF2 family DNA or RNA helicase
MNMIMQLSYNIPIAFFRCDEYNKLGSGKFIFLLTTRAGVLSVNSTAADIVVLYDSDLYAIKQVDALVRY